MTMDGRMDSGWMNVDWEWMYDGWMNRWIVDGWIDAFFFTSLMSVCVCFMCMVCVHTHVSPNLC